MGIVHKAKAAAIAARKARRQHNHARHVGCYACSGRICEFPFNFAALRPPTRLQELEHLQEEAMFVVQADFDQLPDVQALITRNLQSLGAPCAPEHARF